MWTVFEPWQLGQLQRLASLDSERVEEILNTLWNSYPGLMADLAIAAVDQEQLSVDRCAELLQVSSHDVECRLIAFRNPQLRTDNIAVVDSSGPDAKLAEGNVKVWEVVRAYRRLGSVERLIEAFPSLSTNDLGAALKYAEKNPAEIEEQITKYEEVLSKRRAEYPFAR